MAVFVSYARPDEPQAERIAEALRANGYEVWRDDELPAHRAYSEVIEERLKSAKAVVVLWSAEASKSQWVRSEADAARQLGKLVQVTIDGSLPPMPFDQIQCADLKEWNGRDGAGWRKLVSSVDALGGSAEAADKPKLRSTKTSICVLPFQNMSGDAEQEYFSDGISEDITTDLSKVSALAVTARNTAFQFKGQSCDVCDIARRLGVGHVLEGSVRKAGGRVRISAQLIDGASGDHVWAERYDRELTDIFAIQDEITKEIVSALKLKLMPDEKKAIEQRGTRSADAYNLYLMARQYWITGTLGSRQRDELIARICRRVIEIDPNYARAWALLALAQSELRFRHWKMDEDALASADRAQSLDADIAEIHSVRARYLAEDGRFDEATVEVETALRLGPDSWEVNKDAARFFFRQGRLTDALFHFNKAAFLMEMDTNAPMMAMSCSRGLGDEAGLRHAAETTVERTEKALRYDQGNAMLWSNGAAALASLGQAERAKEWVERAFLIEPDNRLVSYNGACTAAFLGDLETAIRLIAPYLAGCSAHEMNHVSSDPDLAPIRDDRRYKKMFADAQARLAKSKAAIESAAPDQSC